MWSKFKRSSSIRSDTHCFPCFALALMSCNCNFCSYLVKTIHASEWNEPADVFLYSLDRHFKIHTIVQELCDGGDLYGLQRSICGFQN